MPMDGTRDEFFASPGFARNQYRAVAISNEANQLLHRAHCLAWSDQFTVLSRVASFGGVAGLRAQHSRDQGDEIVAPDRFREMVESSETHGLNRVAGTGEGGKNCNG